MEKHMHRSSKAVQISSVLMALAYSLLHNFQNSFVDTIFDTTMFLTHQCLLSRSCTSRGFCIVGSKILLMPLGLQIFIMHFKDIFGN